MVGTMEPRPDPPPDDRDLPDAIMMVADTLLVLDNLYNRATVIASVEVPPEAADAELERLYTAAEARIDDWLGRLGAPATLRPLALEPPPPLPATTTAYD